MNQAALEHIRRLLDQRVLLRAERAGNIAVDLHRNAPRGGRNVNMFGLPRSAPGEQPAIETGELLRRLEQRPQAIEGGYRVAVNYAKLEFGYAEEFIEPRPMGRMVLDRLRMEVHS